ncbi:sigma-54 dependent transcriptional regulator, partial [candidate division KSB1 bacterium]|nr:sigma-54 dependent transcriptional regulator [candidate division KSB1 bacterium]
TENVEQWIYEGGEVFALTEQGKNKFLIVFDEDERKYFDCELRIPIFIKGKLTGIFNIGKKSTGTEYSNDDITLFRILASTTSIVLERVVNSNHFIPSKVDQRQPDFSPVSGFKIKRRVETHEMIGDSEAIQRIKHLIERVASKDVTVLISGESGTGKELVARAIHRNSSRSDNQMVAMNCAALPENLVESELFGHEKGAFTGAHCQKKGKFEFADGGTLFLDEIGDMSLATQAKLLRVLQDGAFQRIGGNKTITTDVRLIAATNKNLTKEIREGNFREDLYYRINVVQICIPSLRERPEDIPVLAEYFLEKYNDFYGKTIAGIAPGALERLQQYEFPGNIRELQNIIERAVIMEQGSELSLDFIPVTLAAAPPAIQSHVSSNGTLEDLEREHIKKVIEQVNYNKSEAARILGIARKTLREKMQKYGI